MNIGQLIEDLHCYGWPQSRMLTEQERCDIVEFSITFEECSYERGDLEGMDDKDLVQVSYWIMAEYASGQI
ncbi:hypothetical protein QRD43_21260 [Pelomonas sp. APW6]|uniref:Uncharacterized protein n=1 Tax=Roseateles subflavus TaxID=3053353 RepID=A0ABT7LNJ2_9BURK|nr:hypothetical protein [Pelomonas sp. APW6]MDL5034446.1 hypothetical protein [Pelomonas sp. APW6]